MQILKMFSRKYKIVGGIFLKSSFTYIKDSVMIENSRQEIGMARS